jgi:hypothetical protein
MVSGDNSARSRRSTFHILRINRPAEDAGAVRGSDDLVQLERRRFYHGLGRADGGWLVLYLHPGPGRSQFFQILNYEFEGLRD